MYNGFRPYILVFFSLLNILGQIHFKYISVLRYSSSLMRENMSKLLMTADGQDPELQCHKKHIYMVNSLHGRTSSECICFLIYAYGTIDMQSCVLHSNFHINTKLVSGPNK